MNLEELINDYYSVMDREWENLADKLFYEELEMEIYLDNLEQERWYKYEDYMFYLLNN